MARTIESPGVQITEVDLSLNPVLPTGTNVLVAGFAPQGPTDEVLQVSSLSEFSVHLKPQQKDISIIQQPHCLTRLLI